MLQNSEMTKQYQRDQVTWLLYLALSFYGFILNGLGPVLPFVQEEFQLSYTASSFHTSAFALGMLCAGLISDRLTRHFGRKRLFWGSFLGLTFFFVLFLLSWLPWQTILSAYLMGLIGTNLLVLIPAMLSDKYGNLRSSALAESNGFASFFAFLPPILVGFFAKMAFGWRAGFGTVLVLGLLLVILFRKVKLPVSTIVNSSEKTQQTKQALPGMYWFYWLVILIVVSIEFCTIFWSAPFLESIKGVSKINASTSLSIFMLAMMVGRLFGSRIARGWKNSAILNGSLMLGVVGFGLVVGFESIFFNGLGLFLMGLGVANLYPMAFGMALAIIPDQSDRGSARATLASSLAILLLPLLLGWLADQVGLQLAYYLLLGLYGMAFLLSFFGKRIEGKAPG
jgi:fucose permease